MNKKLPKVFANEINKDLKNNDSVYYENKTEKIVKNESAKEFDLNQKINKIFKSSKYIYKADVDITFKTGKVSKQIIGRNKNELITMDSELIKISDIIDIEFKK